MADQTQKKKQPLSLNERHNRILLDLSASQPQRSIRPYPPEVVEPSAENLEDRPRICKTPHGDIDDDVPGFSGFSDFDSPSPVQSKSPEFEGDGEVSSMVNDKSDEGGSLKLKPQNGCKTSIADNHYYEDDVPSFSGIADFDDSPSPDEIKLSKSENVSVKAESNKFEDSPGLQEQDFPVDIKPSKSEIEHITQISMEDAKSDFEDQPALHEPHFPEKKKTVKVKLGGRRRLCKLSSNDDDDTKDDEPELSGLVDFDSPPTSRDAVEKGSSGGDEIRDLLHDLTSKFDFLSVEKKRPPKTTEPILDSLTERKEEEHDYASATSSFAHSSDRSDSSSDSTSVGTSKIALDKEETYIRSDLKVDGNATRFDGRQNLANRPKEHQATSKIVLDKEETYIRSDRKVDGNAKMFDGRQNLANRPKEHQTKSKIVLDKEETYIRSDLKVDGNARMFDGRQNLANRPKDQTKKIGGKSGHVSKATVNNYVQLLDEDDDDCLILSGKKGHKGERKYDQLQGINDDDDKVDVTEHHNDDFVLEYEKPIISKGSKLTYVLPPKIANMLYAHQREGMKWLWSLHCQGKGGILGDDMGLGKTMQICGFLAGLFNSRLIKRAMVVAPKTLLPHWIKELSVVGLSGKTREYFGTCAKARQYELQYIFQDKGVLLTTYDIVRNNTKALRGDDYFYGERSEDEVTWDYMILDEGHLIKNPSTQRAKSLLEIPAAHRIIISGTPIQNNLKELWALFNFCCPELLGDKAWFKERFESAILHGSDKNASDRQKRIGSAAAKELRERIQPHFLRRLKSEVFCDDNATNTASLSKKNELIVWLKLTSCQRQLYEAFLNSEIVLSAFDGSPLAAITILKKICDHPLLLTKRAAEDVLEGMDSMLNQEDSVIAEKLAMHIADVSERSDFGEKHANISCKISFILSLLDNLVSGGHRILIFSQTRKMLNLIQESLITEGYTFLRIDGTSKASDRLKIVNDFQEGAAPIFLLTSQVGGLGLTLTKADRVIVVDPAWNPSTDNQSVDRAYRIGQKKDVIVYRLMTCGTIEEKIYKKQIFKGALFKTATEHKEQTRYFSQQDLKDMFSLPKHGFDVSITQQQMHQEHDHQHIMDEALKSHIEFLETQGIAGVSHHSLLFSKTAPPPPEGHDDEAERARETTYVRNYASSSRTELDVDGAKYAFNPKDVKLQRDKNNPSTNSGGKHSESEIKERINRLSMLLSNKSLVSKLPDKGDNIQNQIAQLSLELNMIKTAKKKEQTEVVDLDDLAGDFRKVLNV